MSRRRAWRPRSAAQPSPMLAGLQQRRRMGLALRLGTGLRADGVEFIVGDGRCRSKNIERDQGYRRNQKNL